MTNENVFASSSSLAYWWRNLSNNFKALLDYSGWITKLIGSDRYIIDKGTSPKYDGELYFGQGVELGIDKSITVDINAQVQTIYSFVDDVHNYNETNQTLTTYTMNQDAIIRIHRSYIFYNGIFTQIQKDYLEANPEKFLFREFNVLKSLILSQSEIDNIVAYFPLCETGSTVVDLARPIGTVVYDSDFTTNIDGWNKPRGASIITTDNSKLKVSVDGTDTYGASKAVICTIGKYYQVIIDVDLASAAMVRLRYSETNGLGVGIPNERIVTSGIHTLTFLATSTTMYYGFIVTSDNTEFFIIESSVMELQAPHATITNYTDAVRTNADNKSTGLQTCFWKRDELGVPYASSFDRLQSDEIGYMNTNYFIDHTESKQIELILTPRVIINNNHYGYVLNTVTHGAALYLRYNVGSASSLGLNINSLGYTLMAITAATHLVINITPTSYECFQNGVSKGVKSSVPSSFSGNLKIFTKGTNIDGPAGSEMRSFKIRTEFKPIAELYQAAQNEGLLT